MRNLSNRLAGVAGLMILLGALAGTPARAYGQKTEPHDVDAVENAEGCSNLRAPAGHKAAFRLYAEGVQIYRWDGANWIFRAPEAVLYADAKGTVEAGRHYAGPTWESLGGSKVVGSAIERCTVDPNAIPWLLLEAVSNQGPGIFGRVTYIQRVKTVGGQVPLVPGSFAGEETRVPYTAQYIFYREQL